ncbi:MAG: FG-GAP-like repeat-containing protein [Candidatus Acidiferrales bacterium]
MKRASGFAAPSLATILLLALALAFPQFAAAQSTAPIQPPGSVLNAGVVYGLVTCTLDVGAYPPETCTMGVGNGKAAGGFFGNTSNGVKLFDVASTNSTGEGGQLFDFLGNGDGSFAAPTFNSVPYPIVNDGLNVVIAGPVFSPSSVDLVVTDDYNDLYVMEGNGDGAFGAPVALGETAASLSVYLNSGGTLNLVISNVTFNEAGAGTSSAILLVNQGNGTFKATNVPVPGPSTTAYIYGAYALTAGGDTAVLEVYANGAAGLSQSVSGVFQTPVSLGTLGTGTSFVLPNSLSTFTSGGNSYLAGIVTILNVPTAVVWPFSAGAGGISVGGPAYFSIPSNDTVVVSAADLDGDGNPDLIVVGGGEFSTTQTVNLFLSNSTPAFSPVTGEPKPNTILGPGVYGIQAFVADANGDGKNDLILYQPNQGLTVMLNQGDGKFLTPTTLPAGDRPVAIANADFNGDGQDDLAVVNGINSTTRHSDNTVSVMLSQSPGVYSPQSVYVVGTDPIAVAAAKVNGSQSIFVLSQGDASGNLDDPSVAFLQGNGSGAFPAATFFSSGTASGQLPLAIAAGTFDKSGNPTVAVGNSDGTINLFTYSGGTFVPSTATPKLSVSGAPLYGLSISSLAVGDVNGDGNMDLVATQRGICGYNSEDQYTLTSSGWVVIWLGNGDGTFQAPVLVASGEPNSDPAFVTLGSFTNAALPSMLVVDGGGSECEGPYSVGPYPLLFTNNGNLSFTETDFRPSPLELAISNGNTVALTAAIADVNGDGANDIILSEFGIVSALLNNGTGGFSATSPSPLFYVGSSDTAALVGGSFFGPGVHDVGVASLAGAALIKGTPGSSASSGPLATTVTLGFSPVSPVAFGATEILSATVTTTSGNVGSEGLVTFMDGSVTLGTVLPANGVATWPTSTLAVGTHIITANYVDTANKFATQSSGPYLFTVLPLISTFSLSPTSVIGSTSVMATVTLDGAAPAGGAVVTLSTNSGSATVPSTFTIASGTSGTFMVSTLPVTSQTVVTITAFYDGASATATLTINPTAAPSPITIPTITENIITTDSLGNNSTLISATVIAPIVETITTTDSLGSNSTLISATVIAPITEIITTTDTPSALVPNISIQVASETAALVSATTPGYWQVTVAVTNTGNVTASNVSIVSATLGAVAASGFVVGPTIANLAPGTSASFVINFPLSAGAPGSRPAFSVKGTYSGDGLSGNWSTSSRGAPLP